MIRSRGDRRAHRLGLRLLAGGLHPPSPCRHLLLAGLLATAAVAGLPAASSGAPKAAPRHAVVKTAPTKLGPVLVDSRGRTLYMLTADSRAKGRSVCYSTCAKYWPPVLTTGKPSAGAGAKQSLLGTAGRKGGGLQVTYAGHRLYLFLKDTAPGQANGQQITGFGGPVCTASLATKPCVWYAVSPSGAAVVTPAHALVKTASTKLGRVLVDSRGRTLYLLTADSRAKGKSVCYETCAKYWPPLLTAGKPSAGAGAKASLLGVAKRNGGGLQVTYAGHRVYLFLKDTAPGQINGQRVKGFGGPVCTASLATKPCTWYAVAPSGAPVTRAAPAAPKKQGQKHALGMTPSAKTKVSVVAGKPSEFRFTLSASTVPAGSVTFEITDKGAVPHDFKVCTRGGLANTCTGTISKLLSPGQSTSLTVTFKQKGTYEYLCTVPGHAAAGMKGDLKVG